MPLGESDLAAQDGKRVVTLALETLVLRVVADALFQHLQIKADAVVRHKICENLPRRARGADY